MSHLDHDGVAISYTRRGAGPATLWTHGFSATSQMFTDDLTWLSSAYTTIAWDLRGHGDTDSPTDASAYAPERAIADMARLLDDTGVEQAILAGHSLGGYLSMRFALEYPERVSALILMSTGPGFRNPAARAAWNERNEQLAHAVTTGGIAALPAGPERALAVHRDERGVAMAAIHTLGQSDSRVIDGLGEITQPTLVVVGATDTPLLDSATYIASRVPNARLATIASAGHTPNLEQPAAFRREVTSFLDDITPESGAP